VVRLFFLSFFALWNFEFPAKIKKGGGERPTGPPSIEQTQVGTNKKNLRKLLEEIASCEVK
jgi:hypothetical protein